MPPEMQPQPSSGKKDKEGHEHGGHRHHHRERIGNYILGSEIGRGSFATVYKGYRSKTRAPIAIKAVSRQKLTTKLLENLESEINILKVISHRNIVALEDCFKNDSHIYLAMEFCSGSDLSIYIKNRGRLPTLDFLPRGAVMDVDKVFWPHPPTGGIDERITRCFLGQLAQALQFLRSQNLIHRDIKPQNLLLQPATPMEIADGHPLGIPVLKVADFGFARILPAAAMAETLCGSPLYMAPEILRYEKYDAKADLWSVGAVLFEMAVGKPPFRANNHVELLRKIEKGEDRIKFPDESSRPPTDPDAPPPLPVSEDIKTLIRGLLKRHPISRMSFDDFFGCGVWDGHMTESRSTEDGSLNLEVSTDSSAALGASERVRSMLESAERERGDQIVPRLAPQPLSTEAALNPQPARVRSDLEDRTRDMDQEAPSPSPPPTRPPVRRTEPKYYVSDDGPSTELSPTSSPTPTPQTATAVVPSHSGPRPIQTPAQRRLSSREGGSVDEAQPLTPTSTSVAPLLRTRGVGEGSPLAATPPITMGSTGKDESALEGDDSVVGREYVVVEKRTVEVNALADELDQASKKPSISSRRPSSRTSVVSRPVSAFKPAATPVAASTLPPTPQNAVVPLSYSPPFALSTTPPFAIPASIRQPSGTPISISRPPSVPHSLNIFPPTQLYDTVPRHGSSPSSLQTGALARALTNTAIRLIGTSANAASNAIAKVAPASRRRPTIIRTGEIDPIEDDLLRSVEDVARKAFVLFELADARLLTWHHLATTPGNPVGPGASPRRKSSSSSLNSEVMLLRQQESVAGEAVVLFCKALAFIVQGTNKIQRYWEGKAATLEYETSQELNEMVQWLRARFNECYDKAEWAKSECAEELPFVDRLLHDKARETSRHAAIAELQGDFVTAEAGYDTSLWLLQALLDDIMYDGGHIRDEDRSSVEKVMGPIKTRLEALRKKMDTREPSSSKT